MNAIMFVVVAMSGMAFIAFLSGVFENIIVKKCTDCGNEGKTTALCWQYEYMASKPGLSHKPWGVTHSCHLCEKCMDLCARRDWESWQAATRKKN